MAKFPAEAPKRRVIRAMKQLGFRVIREREHVAMLRENLDGTSTPLTMPNQRLDAPGHLHPNRHLAR